MTLLLLQSGRGSGSPPVVGPPPVWADPSDLVGLIGWWDASVLASLTLSGSDITAVADQSGHGNHLVAPGGSFAPPTYHATGLGFLPTMIFSADDDSALWKTGFPFGAVLTLTVFFVGRFSEASTTNARAVSYCGSGAGDQDNDESFMVSRVADTTGITLYRNFADTNAVFGGYDEPHRFICTISPDGVSTVYVDGTPVEGAIATALFGATGDLTIGNRVFGSTSFAWDGALSEIGIATGYHDAVVIADLDNYLALKWPPPPPAELLLSGSTVAEDVAIGTVIGALSVSYSTGSYSYFITADPSGLFAISGSDLTVAATLTAGSYPVTVQATGGIPTTVSNSFMITVTAASTARFEGAIATGPLMPLGAVPPTVIYLNETNPR